MVRLLATADAEVVDVFEEVDVFDLAGVLVFDDLVATLDVVPDLLFVITEHDAPPVEYEHARAVGRRLRTPPVRWGTLYLPNVGKSGSVGRVCPTRTA